MLRGVEVEPEKLFALYVLIGGGKETVDDEYAEAL